MSDREARVQVLLANQPALFRQAVKIVLESEDDLVVVAEAMDGLQAVVEAERTSPDLVLIDANLPNCDGLRATSLIKERVPECRVLVLTEQEEPGTLIEAVEAGASGYLTKECPLSELIQATRAIHRGESLVPARMLGPLLHILVQRRREQNDAYHRLARLTRREREVLALLADGKTNEAISQSLVISPETARTHIRSVLRKLEVHSRLEAAAFVVQNGVMEDLEEVAP